MLNHRTAYILLALVYLWPHPGYAQTQPEESRSSWADNLTKLFQFVDLTCSVATIDGRHRLDIPVHVNYLEGTVNGNKALISDTEIRWVKDQTTAVINRQSGFMRVGVSRNPSVYTGTCSIAKERKF